MQVKTTSLLSALKVGLIPILISISSLINYLLCYRTSSLKDEVMFILFLAIACVVFFILKRIYLQPLKQVSEKALLIAEGDIKQRIDYEKQDEIGQIASAINVLAENNEKAAVFINTIKEGNLEAVYNTTHNDEVGSKDVLAKIGRAHV